MSVLRGFLALLPLLALTGCATSSIVAPGDPGPTGSYGMALAPSPSATSADALVGWPGAAGQVVQCAGPVVGTTRTAPYDGEDTGDSPRSALEAAKEWASWDGAQEGFVLARSEPQRQLYVLEVDGVAKQALILRHGPALTGDGSRKTVTRWWLESWARCDYAELPDAVAQQRGLEIWSGPDGKRALTSEITSFDFGSGCFSGMTALDIGGPLQGGWSKEKAEPVEYVRRPAAELRDEYFHRDYIEHVAVPADAIDSGFERDGEHLWFSKDRGYAYVGSATDADAWPRAVRPVRCA